MTTVHGTTVHATAGTCELAGTVAFAGITVCCRSLVDGLVPFAIHGITRAIAAAVPMSARRTPIRFHHSQDDSPCRCLDCRRLEDLVRRAVTDNPVITSATD